VAHPKENLKKNAYKGKAPYRDQQAPSPPPLEDAQGKRGIGARDQKENRTVIDYLKKLLGATRG
jgi:hypothetical protein